ncbi:hypothetical protein [Loigolactobacillus binensis]|uniref:Uncharacterized protein n=1 Tax=Loigolactobacillus binensis TaxID=2559922 RepID=A0ABW3E8D4_9LACO|nr:hypothetical protein [Loigolactobacillus binensis]
MPELQTDPIFNLSEFHHDFKKFINPMFPTSPTEKEILKNIKHQVQTTPEISVNFPISKDECILGVNMSFTFGSGFIEHKLFLSYRGVFLE